MGLSFISSYTPLLEEILVLMLLTRPSLTSSLG